MDNGQFSLTCCYLGGSIGDLEVELLIGSGPGLAMLQLYKENIPSHSVSTVEVSA